MKTTSILLVLFVAAAVAFFLYSLGSGQSPEEYAKGIQDERQAKDLYMQRGEGSPFVESKQAFGGLTYFPPDLKYRINASLVPIREKKVISLATSDGQEKRYLQHAYAEFEWGGVANKLLILEITDPGPYRGTLYLAFADETSASETYGAGRYLDIKKVPGASSVILDFNKAYNPYCAYADNFSCPFPPKENVLKVAIRAGEKIYHPVK